ncbi:MAG: hypothetical protein ACR2MG_07625 [Pyrinomonadaceae bacterium]
MRFQIIFFTTILAIFLSGCTGSETPVNTTNTANKNTNTTASNTNNPLSTTATPEAATTNNAPTVAPVVKAYYEALKKRDDAALRKVYSQETLKSLEADMKAEKQTSLVKFITELEPVPDKPFEARNEKVEGDTAIAEMRGGSYPNGVKLKFVKESGEWKMTNEYPDFQSVKQSAANSNTAK